MQKSDLKHLLPLVKEVSRGEIYYWCCCDAVESPPLCDSEHASCQPFEYLANRNETVSFCACKQTKTPPFCDGSHASILLKALKSFK